MGDPTATTSYSGSLARLRGAKRLHFSRNDINFNQVNAENETTTPSQRADKDQGRLGDIYWNGRRVGYAEFQVKLSCLNSVQFQRWLNLEFCQTGVFMSFAQHVFSTVVRGFDENNHSYLCSDNPSATKRSTHFFHDPDKERIYVTEKVNIDALAINGQMELEKPEGGIVEGQVTYVTSYAKYQERDDSKHAKYLLGIKEPKVKILNRSICDELKLDVLNFIRAFIETIQQYLQRHFNDCHHMPVEQAYGPISNRMRP